MAAAMSSFVVSGAAMAEGGSDVPSAFFIAKSENKNQVHYGVHVTGDCAPAGAAPVFAYWRMFEKGPTATEPLLAHEVPAYGFASERVTSAGPSGGTIVVSLRAIPERSIVVTTRQRAGACVATAETEIAGTPALLTRVYAQLRWPFGVESLTLDGYATSDGHAVRERIAR